MPGHAPLAEKRPIWEAEDRVRSLQEAQQRAWWEALEASAQAWFLAPDPTEARKTLAELWWHALREAWQDGDGFRATLAQERVEMLDDGHYHKLLAAPSHLSLDAHDDLPARATIARFVERDRLLHEEVVLERDLPHQEGAAGGGFLRDHRHVGRPGAGALSAVPPAPAAPPRHRAALHARAGR